MTKIEYQIPLWLVQETVTSTTYVDASLVYNRNITKIDTSKYVSPTFYFEATLETNTAGQPAYAALFDNGTNDAISSPTQVTGSEITTSVDSSTRVRSSAITLTDGNRYVVRIKATSGYANTINHAYLIIVDDITAGWSKAHHQNIMGITGSNSTSTYQEVGCPMRFYYDSSLFDGTTKVAYLEATMYVSSKTAYCQLWDLTSASQIVEITTTATAPTRVRSADIFSSLTSGHYYCVRFKNYSTKITYGDSARLIIEQTTSITKTSLKFFPCAASPSTQVNSVDWYKEGNSEHFYITTSNYPSLPTCYYQGNGFVDNVLYPVESRIFNISASYVSINQTTLPYYYVSASFSITDSTDLHEEQRKANALSAGYVYPGSLILNVSASGVTNQTVTDATALSSVKYVNKVAILADTIKLTGAVIGNFAKMVLDTIKTTHVDLRGKTAVITSDSISLVDVKVAGKQVVSSDALNLSSVKFVNKTIAFADAVGLTSLKLTNKGAITADALKLSGVKLVNKSGMLTSDAIGLGDLKYVNKGAVSTDLIGLSSIKYVGKALKELDVIGLLSAKYVGKDLIESETINLAVTKYVGKVVILSTAINFVEVVTKGGGTTTITVLDSILVGGGVTGGDARIDFAHIDADYLPGDEREFIYVNKNIIRADSVNLGDVKFIGKGFTVAADILGLASQKYVNKTAIESESFKFNDVKYVNKGAISVDSASLLDAKYVGKYLIEGETFNLVDINYITKPVNLVDNIKLEDTKFLGKTTITLDTILLSDNKYVSKGIIFPDFLNLSDLISRDKTLSESDSIRLSDTKFVDKTIPSVDMVSITEVVKGIIDYELIIVGKLGFFNNVYDGVSFVDVEKVDKNLTKTSDIIVLSDIKYVNIGAVVVETIKLNDIKYVNKGLIENDNIYQTEINLINKSSTTVLDSVLLAHVYIKGLGGDRLIYDGVASLDAEFVGKGRTISSESINLADAKYMNRSATEVDIVVLGDVDLRHKPSLTESDVSALSDVKFVHKGNLLAESVRLSDAILALKGLLLSTDLVALIGTDIVHKGMTVSSDTLKLADALLYQLLKIEQDSLSLLDQELVTRPAITISELVKLAELVTKTETGGIKTVSDSAALSDLLSTAGKSIISPDTVRLQDIFGRPALLSLVVDVLGLTDVERKSGINVIADLFTIIDSDTVYKSGVKTITDAIALAEVKYVMKTLYESEGFRLSDLVTLFAGKTVNEIIQTADGISANKNFLILETIKTSELLLLTKALRLLDTINSHDAVYGKALEYFVIRLYGRLSRYNALQGHLARVSALEGVLTLVQSLSSSAAFRTRLEGMLQEGVSLQGSAPERTGLGDEVSIHKQLFQYEAFNALVDKVFLIKDRIPVSYAFLSDHVVVNKGGAAELDYISISDIIAAHKTLLPSSIISTAHAVFTDRFIPILDMIHANDIIFNNTLDAYIFDIVGLRDSDIYFKECILTETISLVDVKTGTAEVILNEEITNDDIISTPIRALLSTSIIGTLEYEFVDMERIIVDSAKISNEYGFIDMGSPWVDGAGLSDVVFTNKGLILPETAELYDVVSVLLQNRFIYGADITSTEEIITVMQAESRIDYATIGYGIIAPTGVVPALCPVDESMGTTLDAVFVDKLETHVEEEVGLNDDISYAGPESSQARIGYAHIDIDRIVLDEGEGNTLVGNINLAEAITVTGKVTVGSDVLRITEEVIAVNYSGARVGFGHIDTDKVG